MTEQQRPACPAEYEWIKPGVWVEYDDGKPRKYLVKRSPEIWGKHNWVAFVAKSESKRAVHTYLPCDDLTLTTAPEKKASELETLRASLARLEAENERLKSDVEMLRKNVKSENSRYLQESINHGMTQGSLMIARVDISMLKDKLARLEAENERLKRVVGDVREVLGETVPIMDSLKFWKEPLNELTRSERDRYRDVFENAFTHDKELQSALNDRGLSLMTLTGAFIVLQESFAVTDLMITNKKALALLNETNETENKSAG